MKQSTVIENTLHTIQKKYAHIHPDWHVSKDILLEMLRDAPHYHFDIEPIIGDNYRFERHTHSRYQSTMDVVEIAHPSGIHIMHAKLHSNSDGFLHVQTPTPYVQFFFARHSDRSYYSDSKLIGSINSGQHQGYVFFPELNTALWTTLPNDEFIEVNLSVPLLLSCCSPDTSLYRHLAEILISKRSTAIFPTAVTTSYEQMQLLDELVSKPILGADAAALYTKAKVFQLVALLMEQYDYQTPKPIGSPHVPQEMVSIMTKAKEILDQEIDHPPTIEELSLRLGTNENYLKKYFKIIHQSTVHNYVANRRMQIAKYMLQHGEKTVNEISRFLGYKSHAHFSYSFKKHYGLAPKMIKRTHKGYRN